MTNKDAIENLIVMSKANFEPYSLDGEWEEAIEYGIHALEKQEEIQPFVFFRRNRNCSAGIKYEMNYYCPRCKYTLYTLGSTNQSIRWNYCPNCGQKLNWLNTEGLK